MASANVGEALLLLLAQPRHAHGAAAPARELAARAAAALERGMGVTTPLLDEARALAAR